MMHVGSGGAGFMLYSMTITTDDIEFEQSPTIPVHELVSIAIEKFVIKQRLTLVQIRLICYNQGRKRWGEKRNDD